MSAITKIRGWKNPGFSEDGPDAPHVGYTLPTADQTLQPTGGFHPSADRMFSEVKISGAAWESWREMSFLELTYSWNNSLNTTVLYGFVDSVELVSDTNTNAVVAVKWHVDEWMTYLGSSTLKFGHVLRRPVSGSEPIQGYTPRYWQAGTRTDAVPVSVINNIECWWILVAYGVKANVGDTMFSRVGYAAWPINKNNSEIYGLANSVSTPFIPYYSTLRGDWDEMLGIAPDQVLGAWLLPCSPLGLSKWTGTGSNADPLVIVSALTAGWSIVADDDGTFAHFSAALLPQLTYDKLFPEYSAVSYVTTPSEMNPLHVLGFDGSSILQLPINMALTSYRYRVVVSATSCYIELRFDGALSRAEGLCAVIPALALDLTENAWSEYFYSGQREYDITMRNNESIKSGIESISSGALQGGLLGGFNPMIGGGVGAAAGAISGGVSLATDLLWYNEATQNAKDTLMANQSPGILMQGEAWDAMHNGITVSFCTMSMDTYSSGRVTSERSLVGVKVDEYITSNTSIRSSTGFYQIVNLDVSGAIPNSARRTIANRFAKGVRLI